MSQRRCDECPINYFRFMLMVLCLFVLFVGSAMRMALCLFVLYVDNAMWMVLCLFVLCVDSAL